MRERRPIRIVRVRSRILSQIFNNRGGIKPWGWKSYVRESAFVLFSPI